MSDAASRTDQPIDIHLGSGLALFAIKTCIVAAVIVVSTIIVANAVIDSVEGSTARTMDKFRAQWLQTPIGGTQFWSKVEHELDRAADPKSDLPPEQKQKLVNDVRVIVARWRPFIEAVQGEAAKPAKDGQ
jgi:hypothetical protein